MRLPRRTRILLATAVVVALASAYGVAQLVDDPARARAFLLLAILVIAAGYVGTVLRLMRRAIIQPVTTLDNRLATIESSGRMDLRIASGPLTPRSNEIDHLIWTLNGLLDTLEAHTVKLEHSNEELGRFAATASHDLRSPLSTFKINLSLLSDPAAARSDPQEQQRIARMERAVDSMDDRIQGILSYARSHDPESGFGPVDLNTVLTQVQGDLAADVERTKAVLIVEALPTIIGDPVQLAQVFQNIIGNALKFTRPGKSPWVRITSRQVDSGWTIRVEDHGIGFDPAHVDRLFKPFSRLANAAKIDGQGIGLATCARIVDRHGGRLWAAGRPGEGATFTLLLRAAADGTRAPAAVDSKRHVVAAVVHGASS